MLRIITHREVCYARNNYGTVGENQLGAQSHPVYKVYDYASAPVLLLIYKLNICVDFMCSTLYTVVSPASSSDSAPAASEVNREGPGRAN